MTRFTRHLEHHASARRSWLRAAVLGANDGIVSTASLIIGVATARGTPAAIVIAGLSGLVAGAMSMAAGEYVSVSSQLDSERADIRRERYELHANPEGELKELEGIYVRRGLDRALAQQVAEQLTAGDALGAHTRDELGITESLAARPVQAAIASATSFAAGAALPLVTAVIAPGAAEAVPVASLVFLALLGAVGARIGGAPMLAGAIRVVCWSALAMAVTAAIGALVGTGL